MDEQTSRAFDAITQSGDDLDGHTIEELADYLDAGRSPRDESIESSASCRHAIAALARLRRVAREFMADPPDIDPVDPSADDAWVSSVLSRIALDAHAGADFPLAPPTDDVALVMSEGALRALVRAAGDDEAGFLVGRILFASDLQDLAQPLRIRVNVTVLHGLIIPEAVDRLRARIAASVLLHTAFTAIRTDITVQDLDVPNRGASPHEAPPLHAPRRERDER